ncbi:MAG: glycosyltransferase family 9 protein [Patescibacteria group bacterium]|nr:glycosyltransferase family 9 protein [Patescibacteria group bacterium]
MSILDKIKLFIVKCYIKYLNFFLNLFRILFFKKIGDPKNILIYKIGNIGDIICAVPSFIAIRRANPNAKITLLTSPGEKGSLGANELLTGTWYFNELKIYYSEDLNSFDKKIDFISNLKKNNYDLFIQLPDDLADFRTLFRNLIFTRAIGAKSAFGFKIRTIQLFKKAQVNYLSNKTEVESLLDILKENGIKVGKVEFDFNITEEQKQKISALLEKKWGEFNKSDIIVAISSGGKRETNQWPVERFREIAEYLCDKYNAKIVIVGGKNDINKAKFIIKNLKDNDYLIAAGKIGILETMELFKKCSFLIANSTGTIHLAASVGLSAIGIYSIRDIFGRWFPYGFRHKILYQKFLDCDYKKEKCIKKSIEMISIDDVKKACDEFIMGKI